MTVTQRKRTTLPAAPKGKKLTWVEASLLAAAAAYGPVEVVANNPLDIGHPERVVILIGLLWIGGVMAAAFLVRRGARPTSAALSVFLVLVVLSRGGPVLVIVLGGPGHLPVF